MSNEGAGSWVINLSYDYNNLNTLNAGTDTLDDDSRLRVTNSILLNLGYAISNRFSVESLFTWVNQTRTISQFGNEDFTETSGIGDAVFLLRYTIPNVLGDQSSVAISSGVKAPVGRSDLLTNEGFQLTADLQPGSGAWDYVGLISVSKNLPFRPSATLAAGATFRLTGANSDYLNGESTYEFGNEVQAILGYTDQFLLFSAVFNPALILKYRKAGIDKINGFDLNNTGGEWLFIRPEIFAYISPSIAVVSRLEVPLYSYVDGTQLTPTLRFTGGLQIKLMKKNDIEIENQNKLP
ncbi:hypothetical protein [Allomuricauda sp. d1]|uniref:hypothetical protein n=1 Tax=Allomuricauda sp. d1 TaxID=3136725 RepID=UPI0031DF3AA3